jgi:hypothetical protein
VRGTAFTTFRPPATWWRRRSCTASPVSTTSGAREGHELRGNCTPIDGQLDHRVDRSSATLRRRAGIEDPHVFVTVHLRHVRVPVDDCPAIREPRGEACLAALPRPGVVPIPIRASPTSTTRCLASRCFSCGSSMFPWIPSTGGPISRRSLSTAAVTKSPACRTSSACASRVTHSWGSARVPLGRCVSAMIATRIRTQPPRWWRPYGPAPRRGAFLPRTEPDRRPGDPSRPRLPRSRHELPPRTRRSC